MNQRQELHKTIWAIANELRGAVDGWDFKNYVLGFMFYRFISENLTAHLSSEEDGDYSTLPDDTITDYIAEIVNEKGFFIYPSQLFTNIYDQRNDPNINERLKNIFTNIENSANGTVFENDIKGLFADVDVNKQQARWHSHRAQQKTSPAHRKNRQPRLWHRL